MYFKNFHGNDKLNKIFFFKNYKCEPFESFGKYENETFLASGTHAKSVLVFHSDP